MIQPSNSLRVFISYSRIDLAIAEALKAGLVDRGIEAFLDVHDIAPGEDWKNRLRGLIASAEKVALLVSPDSVLSDICAWEVDEAERQAKPVFPVVVRDTETEQIPGRLARLNYTFYRTEEERVTNLDRLADALKTDLLWEREKTKLNDQAEAWQTAGRSRRLLITRDDAIRHAETWRDGMPENAQPPTEVQRDFIRESRVHLGRRQRRIRFGLSALAVIMTAVAAFAVVQQQIAARNLEEAETVTAFIDDAFASVDPRVRGKDILFIEVMDAAAERLAEGGVQFRPTAEARLRDTIGWSYLQLGAYDKADLHLTFAQDTRSEIFGENAPAAVTSLYRKMLNDWYLNRTDGLEDRMRDIIDRQRDAFGENGEMLAVTYKDLSWWLMLEGRLTDAREAAEMAVAIFRGRGDDAPPTREYIETVNNYGSLKMAIAEKARFDGDLQTAQAYFSAAEQDLSNAVDMYIEVLGPDSAGLSSAYNNLANVYSSLWRNDEAEAFHQKNVDLASRTLGDAHYATLLGRSNLAGLLAQECRVEEARDIYEMILPGWAEVGGQNQPIALDTQEAVLNVYFQFADFEKAASGLEELYETRRRVNGETATKTLDTLGSLVVAQSWADNHQRSLELAEQHYAGLKQRHGDADLATGRARWILADYLLAQGEHDTVRRTIEEQLRSFSKVRDDPDDEFAKAADEWAIRLSLLDVEERKYESAIERLADILERNDQKHGPHNENSIEALNRLSVAYGRQGQPERSTEFREDRLARLLEKWGDGAPIVWQERERLTRLYLRTKQLDLAEQTLSHFVMRGDHPCDPARLPETQLLLVRDLIKAGEHERAADLAMHVFEVHDRPTGEPSRFVLRALRQGAKARMRQARYDEAESLIAIWKDRLERAVEPSTHDNLAAADAALVEIARRRTSLSEGPPD